MTNEPEKQEEFSLLEKIDNPYLLQLYTNTLIKIIDEKIKTEKLNLE